jgi:hypothetical protein
VFACSGKSPEITSDAQGASAESGRWQSSQFTFITADKQIGVPNRRNWCAQQKGSNWPGTFKSQ